MCAESIGIKIGTGESPALTSGVLGLWGGKVTLFSAGGALSTHDCPASVLTSQRSSASADAPSSQHSFGQSPTAVTVSCPPLANLLTGG
jgi:hypothetical protein